MNQICYFNYLPQEAQLNILQKNDDLKTLGRYPQVCKRWARLTNSDSFWEEIFPWLELINKGSLDSKKYIRNHIHFIFKSEEDLKLKICEFCLQKNLPANSVLACHFPYDKEYGVTVKKIIDSKPHFKSFGAVLAIKLEGKYLHSTFTLIKKDRPFIFSSEGPFKLNFVVKGNEWQKAYFQTKDKENNFNSINLQAQEEIEDERASKNNSGKKQTQTCIIS